MKRDILSSRERSQWVSGTGRTRDQCGINEGMAKVGQGKSQRYVHAPLSHTYQTEIMSCHAGAPKDRGHRNSVSDVIMDHHFDTATG